MKYDCHFRRNLCLEVCFIKYRWFTIYPRCKKQRYDVTIPRRGVVLTTRTLQVKSGTWLLKWYRNGQLWTQKLSPRLSLRWKSPGLFTNFNNNNCLIVERNHVKVFSTLRKQNFDALLYSCTFCLSVAFLFYIFIS